MTPDDLKAEIRASVAAMKADLQRAVADARAEAGRAGWGRDRREHDRHEHDWGARDWHERDWGVHDSHDSRDPRHGPLFDDLSDEFAGLVAEGRVVRRAAAEARRAFMDAMRRSARGGGSGAGGRPTIHALPSERTGWGESDWV